MYDIAIINGSIIDGTGSTIQKRNLYIKNDIIEIISSEIYKAKYVIDASGLAVSPGFIDIHTHSDISALFDNTMESKILQGVTLELAGNCGNSSAPAVGELEAHNYKQGYNLHSITEVPDNESIGKLGSQMERVGITNNYASLVGHSTLRKAIVGEAFRDSTDEEIEAMCSLLEKQIIEGAFGISFGLIYAPSSFAKKEELIALAKIVSKYQGIVAFHMRNEGAGIFEALDECIEIAQLSGAQIQISHLKLSHKSVHLMAGKVLDKIERARSRGVKIYCDQYPYRASSTSLKVLLPPWALDGGVEQALNRLINEKGEITKELDAKILQRGGASNIFINNTFGRCPEYEEKYLNEILEERGWSEVECIKNILIDCKLRVSAIYFTMDDEDVYRFLKQEDIAVSSDGRSFTLNTDKLKGNPHPRNFGAFPRALKLMRDRKLLPLELAIHKMTSLPASILGISDRGIIQEGKIADLVIFNPETIEDTASFKQAASKPKGIVYVIVNGQIVVKEGNVVKSGTGRFIKKSLGGYNG
ncbi:MAG: amidohydrolase family protein [Maledivibacter sp.]|jgi:N-acyl-D-amino-acid deacylase|nr:amidohydrolase family protein [Maledivibacter sp.]